MKIISYIFGATMLITLMLTAPSFAITTTTGGTTDTNGATSGTGSTAPCPGGNFLGLTKWDAYLPGQVDPYTGQCIPTVNKISDVWLIIAAVIEMLLRIAGLGAVVMLIFGGIKYTTSMGSPESVTSAKNTITYALIGLVLAISAAFLVTFIAGSVGA